MKTRPFIIGIKGQTLTPDERNLIQAEPPLGVIPFVRNVDNPEQLRALIDDIKSTTAGVTRIFIDQEGGRVQRLFPPFWNQLPSVRSYDGLKGQELEDAIYAHHRLIADDLMQMGIDVNCAPCLDLRWPMTAEFLQDRTFHGSVERVVQIAKIARRAMMDGGVFAVAKHIPGHGRGEVDSHKELPVVVFDKDPLGDQLPDDCKVFAGLDDYEFGMCAHIHYPQIDDVSTLTLSRKGFDFIRKKVGFNGIMMSDDLDMKALKGSQSELARQTLEVGADIALSCSGKFIDIKDLYESDLYTSSHLTEQLELIYATQKLAALSQKEKLEYLKQIPSNE